MNELISDEGVCRTAPATPGLLIMQAKDILNTEGFKIASLHCIALHWFKSYRNFAG